MRVAAGVLLIIAAVINLFAGLAYLGGGAAVGSMDKLAAMAEEQQRKQGTLTDAQKQQYEDMQHARSNMNAEQRAKMDSAARVAMAYGLFMLVTVGTSIAGAVCLFRRRAVKFIVVAAALALAVEVIGCVVAAVFLGVALGATKLLFSAIGIIGGCLALAGARQIAMANAVPVDVPPMTPPV